VNFDSQSGYRLIDNRQSDPSVQTKLSDFISGIIVTSSSSSTSFFIDVMGLVMCSIWKDHPKTLIFILYTLVSRRWVTELSSKNSSHLALIGHDFHSLLLSDNLNGCEADWMHLLQALKLQSCHDVTWSQSAMCSDFSESIVVLIWCESAILYCLRLNLSWLRKKIWAGREDYWTMDQSDR
jgi:hypothetical protein